MSESKPNHDQKLVEKLESLRAISPRDPAEQQRRRTAFLSEVQNAAHAVSPAQKGRLIGWKTPFIRKEIKPMFSSIVAVIVALTLALGGAGVTVAAAQTALPGEALYGIKTASEDVRLAFSGEENQLALNLEFSQRRLEEMAALAQNGQTTPEGVAVRLQAQIENAFQIAAAQQEQVMLQTLEQLRTRLQDQEQLCTQLQEQNQNQSFDQIKEMIQERLRLIENGIQDPQAFRDQVGEGLNRPTDQPEPGEGGPGEPQGTPVPGNGPGEPQATPGVGPGEPGYGTGEPGFGPGEPQATPGAGTGEPGYGPGDPKNTPGAGTGEPGSGPGEPQPTPGSGEPQNTPKAVTSEPGTGPGGKP